MAIDCIRRFLNETESFRKLSKKLEARSSPVESLIDRRAAAIGHEAVVKLLLAKNGVEPDSKDIYGRTLLSRAARGGSQAAAREGRR